MKMSPGDIADRFTILALKKKHLPPSEETSSESARVGDALISESGVWVSETQALYDVNSKIWDLESDLHQGKLQNPQTEAEFAEIGRRALAIRDLNRERIRIKNAINARLGEGFQEIKGNHCSEIATPPA